MPYLLIIQISLLLAWYAVPAFTTIPAAVVFLPLIFVGALIGLIVVIFLLAFGFSVVASR
jgi:hypothetical protein